MSTCIYALNIYLEKKRDYYQKRNYEISNIKFKKICLIHHLKIALSFTDVNEKHLSLGIKINT